MIEYVDRSGPPEALNCPAFICDACRRQVVGNGNVMWSVKYEGEHRESSPLFVSHQSRCCGAVEELIGRLYPEELGWSSAFAHEMHEFVEGLSFNSTHAFGDDPDGEYHHHRLVQPGGRILPALPGTPSTLRKAR